MIPESITSVFGTIGIVLSLFVIFRAIRAGRILGGIVGRAVALSTAGMITSLVNWFVTGGWFMMGMSRTFPENYLAIVTIFLLIISDVFWIAATYEIMKLDEFKPRKKK
jgi:hypothetical protein